MSGNPGEPPKLDFKLFVMPAVFFLSRYVDLKDDNIVNLCRQVFITVAAIVGALYYVVYTLISSKNDQTKIWVPPKPKPSLPFGLGPPAEAVKPDEYEETTYVAYELKTVQAEISQLLLSFAMTLFMSFQFKIHLSLLMQSVNSPITLLSSPTVLKYFFKITKNSDGSKLYKELLSAPSATTGDSAFFRNDEPRVEEIPIEDTTNEVNKKVSKSTPVSEVD